MRIYEQTFSDGSRTWTWSSSLRIWVCSKKTSSWSKLSSAGNDWSKYFLVDCMEDGQSGTPKRDLICWVDMTSRLGMRLQGRSHVPAWLAENHSQQSITCLSLVTACKIHLAPTKGGQYCLLNMDYYFVSFSLIIIFWLISKQWVCLPAQTFLTPQFCTLQTEVNTFIILFYISCWCS